MGSFIYSRSNKTHKSELQRMTKIIKPLLLLLGAAKMNANQVCTKDGRPNWCVKSYNNNYDKLRVMCEKPNSKVSTSLCCKTCEKFTDEVEIIKHQYGLEKMFDKNDFIASYTNQTIPDYTELPMDFFKSSTGATLLNFFQSKTDNLFGVARNPQDWTNVMACRVCTADSKMLVLNGDDDTIWRGTMRSMGFVENEEILILVIFAVKITRWINLGNCAVLMKNLKLSGTVAVQLIGHKLVKARGVVILELLIMRFISRLKSTTILEIILGTLKT